MFEFRDPIKDEGSTYYQDQCTHKKEWPAYDYYPLSIYKV